MNNGVAMLLGVVLGAATGAGITYVVMNKRQEREMNEFIGKVRADFAKEREAILNDLHKEEPGISKRREDERNRNAGRRMVQDLIRKKGYAMNEPLEPEEPETVVAPDNGPGPDPEDPDALYPISESELRNYIEAGEDPEDLLLSADGELHFMDFRPYDSPYIFDGIDIKGLFGKYTGDDGVVYFRDPVSNISYRVYKSLKDQEEMEELAQKGIE